MLEIEELTDTHLELLLDPHWEEALEWQAQIGPRHTGRNRMESISQLVGIVHLIDGDGDWLTIQTRGDVRGRYA